MIDLSKLTGRAAAALAMVMALAFTGCGGGGGGGGGGSNAPAAAPPPAATAPVITTQPADQSVVVGSTASFTVAATDAASYQWQVSSDGTTFTDVAGASSASYTTPATALADSGRQYRAVAANRVGSVRSNAARLTINPFVGRFAYVTNEADNTISIYTINAASGQLRHRGYAQTGTGPKSVAVDASGKFAYVVNATSNNVSAYAIDAGTGSLSPVAGSPFATGVAPQAVTVDPKGRFAYVTNMAAGSGGSVSAFTIDAATGALAAVAGSPFASGVNPYSVAAEPSGKYLYVANGGGSVSAYAIHNATGALTSVAGSPFVSGNGTYFVTVDPSGRFVYAANGGGGTISAFTINPVNGVLTSAGSTRVAATGLRNLAIDPFGKFMYAANVNGDNVFAFTIAPTTGALTAVTGSPFVAGRAPWSVAVDPSGSFAYVGNQGSNDVSPFRIDANTGALTALPKVASRVSPSFIAMTQGAAAVTYTPKALYAAHYGQSDVVSYTIDAATGAITHAGNTPTRPFGTSIAIDPTGRFAYTTHDIQNPEFPVSEKFLIYTINPAISAGGALTRTGAFVTASEGPWSIRIEPSGRFAYVAFGLGGIGAYRIDATTGTLLELPGAGTGPFGNAFSIDPAGRFMYVANAYLDNPGSGSISAFAIDSATGGLTPIDLNASLAGVELTTGPNPSSVAVDSSGRFVYVTHRNGVAAYVIDPTSGLLINASGSVLADVLAADPWSVAVDPSSRFAYVANRGTDDVTAFRIDTSTGGLTRIGTVAVGDYPSSITVDASGQFVYVANAGSNTLSALRINANTGALTLIGSVASGHAPSGIATSGSMQ